LRALCVVDFLQFLSRLRLRESLLFSNVKGRQKCTRDFYCFVRLYSIKCNMPLYRQDVNVSMTASNHHLHDSLSWFLHFLWESWIVLIRNNFFLTSYYLPSLYSQFYCVYSTCRSTTLVASCRYFNVDS